MTFFKAPYVKTRIAMLAGFGVFFAWVINPDATEQVVADAAHNLASIPAAIGKWNDNAIRDVNDRLPQPAPHTLG